MAAVLIAFFLLLPALRSSAAQPFAVLIAPGTVKQGGVAVIEVLPFSPTATATVIATVGGAKVGFLARGGRYYGFFGAHAKAKAGEYPFSLTMAGVRATTTLRVAARAFPETKLVVTPPLQAKGYTPTKIAQNLAAKDNPTLAAASRVFTAQPYFMDAFVFPLAKVADVGAFGNFRESGGMKLQHLGVDLEAAQGTPVRAVNDGVVTLRTELVNYGKTLVVDHGVGIYSFYLHLNEFKVRKGERVSRGQTIALSGNTGYSIEPHLHLSMSIAGASVDPLKFIALTQEALR